MLRRFVLSTVVLVYFSTTTNCATLSKKDGLCEDLRDICKLISKGTKFTQTCDGKSVACDILFAKCKDKAGCATTCPNSTGTVWFTAHSECVNSPAGHCRCSANVDCKRFCDELCKIEKPPKDLPVDCGCQCEGSNTLTVVIIAVVVIAVVGVIAGVGIYMYFFRSQEPA